MKRILMTLLVLAVSAHYAWSAPQAGPGPMPFGPGPAFAGPGAGHGPGHGPGPDRLNPLARLADDLGLSAEQKHGVALLLKKGRDEFRQAGQAMGQAMDAMHRTMEAEPMSEEAIKQANKAVAAAGEKMALLWARQRADFRALLTPQQRAEMDKKAAQSRERMEQARMTTDDWIERYAK